jgi:hypothetical protein
MAAQVDHPVACADRRRPRVVEAHELLPARDRDDRTGQAERVRRSAVALVDDALGAVEALPHGHEVLEHLGDLRRDVADRPVRPARKLDRDRLAVGHHRRTVRSAGRGFAPAARVAQLPAGYRPRVPRLGDNARRGLRRPSRVAVDAAGYGLAAALAALAAARGGKAVHPHGVAYRARLTVDGACSAPAASQLFATPAEHQAVMRFSRSVGVPRPIPDLLGVSLRVLDAYGAGRHQDFLLVSSIDLPVLHHIFVPATDVQQRPYSSSLPYRAGEQTFIVGVVPDPGSPRPAGEDELDRLDHAAATGRLRFALAVAPLGGRFRSVGTLSVQERLSPAVDALRFNPFNCGGGMEPVSVLNRLRDYAYPLSQRTWARRGDGARAQLEADAAVARLRDEPGAPAAGAAPR